MKLVFEFPLPPAELSPNKERNGHWTQKAKATVDYRQACKLLTRHQLGAKVFAQEQIPFPVTMLVEYYCCRERDARGSKGRYLPRDCFNVPRSLKACIDGMIDACVLPDDSVEYISEATVRLFHVSERAGAESKVRITLTSQEEHAVDEGFVDTPFGIYRTT